MLCPHSGTPVSHRTGGSTDTCSHVDASKASRSVREGGHTGMTAFVGSSQNGQSHTDGKQNSGGQGLGKGGEWPGDCQPLRSSDAFSTLTAASHLRPFPIPGSSPSFSPGPCGVNSSLRKLNQRHTRSHRKNAETPTPTARKLLPAPRILRSPRPSPSTQLAPLLGTGLSPATAP